MLCCIVSVVAHVTQHPCPAQLMVRTEREDNQATKNKPGQEKIPRNTEVCHFVKRSGFLEHTSSRKNANILIILNTFHTLEGNHVTLIGVTIIGPNQNLLIR